MRVGVENILSVRHNPLKNRRTRTDDLWSSFIGRSTLLARFFLSFLAGNGNSGGGSGGREDERSRGGGEMEGRQEEIGRSPQRRRTQPPWPGRVRVISAAAAAPLCVNKGQFKESRRRRERRDALFVPPSQTVRECEQANFFQQVG